MLHNCDRKLKAECFCVLLTYLKSNTANTAVSSNVAPFQWEMENECVPKMVEFVSLIDPARLYQVLLNASLTVKAD